MSGQPPEEIWEESLDEGERRLNRRFPGLAATGFAGGADLLFGIVAVAILQGALHKLMPESPAHVLASVVFGIGFVFITIGRAELFTENFLIPVGAVFDGRSTVGTLIRMWVVTFVLNMVGLALFAGLFAIDGVLSQDTLKEAGALADAIGQRDSFPSFISAVIAGTVMTLFTWVAAASDGASARILASLIVGFLLMAPSLNHAVVGFGEIIFGIFAGTAESDWLDLLRNTALAIAGNLIGGVGLVFSTRLAQVRSEPNSGSGGSATGR